ncbi:hypothetical protein F511_43051 [Dorcoceras hygrometricum]|uniref:Uncharacterized protein n=1 Tax=Dorcoceras hygrometricum TaxID=472368 RepID=A0A2Z7DBG1_9LAMI|nr:hypothetical protein F511_43051 [Dorcoceras hygrometricum]
MSNQLRSEIWIVVRHRFEKPNLVRAGRYERVHMRRRLVVARWFSVWSRSGVVLRSALLLFIEAYLLRLSAVGDSDCSKIGSFEFPLLRRLHYDQFRRLGLSWKKNAKEIQCAIVRIRADLVLLFSSETEGTDLSLSYSFGVGMDIRLCLLPFVAVVLTRMYQELLLRTSGNTMLLISLLGYLLAAMIRVDSYHALMSFGNSRLSDVFMLWYRVFRRVDIYHARTCSVATTFVRSVDSC